MICCFVCAHSGVVWLWVLFVVSFEFTFGWFSKFGCVLRLLGFVGFIVALPRVVVFCYIFLGFLVCLFAVFDMAVVGIPG